MTAFVKKLFEAWWREQVSKGDPRLNSSLVNDAFEAGAKVQSELIRELISVDAPYCEKCGTITVRGDDSAKCLNCGHEKNWWAAKTMALRSLLEQRQG